MNILKKIFSINHILSALGFVFKYLVPIILFGEVVPYTHDTINAGLTKAGYIAFAILVIIICRKIKEKIHHQPKSFWRGVILMLFPIAYWGIAVIGINYLTTFLLSVSKYVQKLILFIVLGHIFYIAEETLSSKEAN